MRRAGCVDQARPRSRLRPPRLDHARIHRLDRRSPLPVRRRALPPVGLAPRSGSRRPPRRILHRRRARLSCPTHHLHGTPRPFSLRFETGENSMDDKAEKVALFRYGLIAPLELETLPRGELTRRAQELAARLYDIPHSTRRQVSVDTLLEGTLRYRRNGLTALTPQPRQDRGQQRAVTPETAALIERLKRETPYLTGTALVRELAPAQAPDKAAPLSASTLYRYPARSRTHRTPIAPRQSRRTQKVRSRVCQPDLAVRYAVWPLGSALRGRQDAGVPAGYPRRRQPPHPARAVLSQPRPGLVSRLPAPSHRRTRHSHAPLHGQRQDLPLSAVGAHRRLPRHLHHPHPALSARRPRQNRTLLPFGARAVSRRPRSSPNAAVDRSLERTAVALARHRLSLP